MKKSTIADHYDVMISYASVDQSICHQLVNYLICNSFHVWFHLNPADNEFNRVTTEIVDNSDCVVLCISEAYSRLYHCQKVARYASGMH